MATANEVMKCVGCGYESPFEVAGNSCPISKCPGFMTPRDRSTTPESQARPMTLTNDSKARKDMPICTGVLDYFPAAMAALARLAKKGNDKHNPGEPLHWARGKSQDHPDCIVRHLIDRGAIDPDSGEFHEVCLAWRALALLQLAEEERGAPMARGARIDT